MYCGQAFNGWISRSELLQKYRAEVRKSAPFRIKGLAVGIEEGFGIRAKPTKQK